MKDKKIILVGAGNVASHMAPALVRAGANLCQIYSRTMESARTLGQKTGITYTDSLSAIYPDGDVYLFCVGDSVLPGLLKAVRTGKDALLLHTSGSLPMDLLAPYSRHYGVVYPIQTFTKRRELDFREIPLCIEASSGCLDEVRELAGLLSEEIREVSSEKRKVLHLAAVFANNFVNYMYGVAGRMLEEEGLDFALLRPIIFETAHKVMQLSPGQAQTGPARRGDENVLNMHRSLLEHDPKLLNLYNLISEAILAAYAPAPVGKTGPENAPAMLSLW